MQPRSVDTGQHIRCRSKHEGAFRLQQYLMSLESPLIDPLKEATDLFIGKDTPVKHVHNSFNGWLAPKLFVHDGFLVLGLTVRGNTSLCRCKVISDRQAGCKLVSAVWSL